MLYIAFLVNIKCLDLLYWQGESQVIWVFIKIHLSINFQLIVNHKAFFLSLNHDRSETTVLFSALLGIEAESLLKLSLGSSHIPISSFPGSQIKMYLSSRYHYKNPNKFLRYGCRPIASNKSHATRRKKLWYNLLFKFDQWGVTYPRGHWENTYFCIIVFKNYHLVLILIISLNSSLFFTFYCFIFYWPHL